MIHLKIACTIFGIVLVVLNSIVSSLFCEKHPKALWLFCLAGGNRICNSLFVVKEESK